MRLLFIIVAASLLIAQTIRGLGLGLGIQSRHQRTPPAPESGFRLLEDGSKRLLEDGSFRLLEG